MLCDLSINYGTNKHKLEEKKNNENTNLPNLPKISFISLDESIMTQRRIIDMMKILKVDMKIPCFICMNDFNLIDMTDIHDNLHPDKLCKDCLKKLSKCPLCRQDLH